MSISIIQVMLDDHILKAQTMHSSAYIKPFEEEMKEWEDKLISMQVRLFCTFSPFIILIPRWPGHTGCLAEMSRIVALPRANLQQRGHHETDARGGEEVQQGDHHQYSPSSPWRQPWSVGWPDLEKHHGQDCVGHSSTAGYKSTQYAGQQTDQRDRFRIVKNYDLHTCGLTYFCFDRWGSNHVCSVVLFDVCQCLGNIVWGRVARRGGGGAIEFLRRWTCKKQTSCWMRSWRWGPSSSPPM